MSTEPKWAWREFTITGKVYSPSKDVGTHMVYWAIRNSDSDSDIQITELQVNGDNNG